MDEELWLSQASAGGLVREECGTGRLAGGADSDADAWGEK
jgi:hypothetical protein